jgi:hypothetical protein
MPERRNDNHGNWKYDAVFPGMDLLSSPSAVTPPRFVEAWGIGRFMGAVRSFPGFADVTVHGVPEPEAGVTTIESISNIQFVKYASMRKGTGPHRLSGLVYLADNQGGDGQSLYFAYRDSEDGSTDVVELEDFASWTDFLPANGTLESYDVTTLGRYIYLVNSGDTTSSVTEWQDKEPPYNKAYWWDFKINDWDKYVSGFTDRLMGLLPLRCMLTKVNEQHPTNPALHSYQALTCGVAGDRGGTEIPYGHYSAAVELVSRKHRLRSFLRIRSCEIASDGALRVRVQKLRIPDDQAGAKHQLRGNTTSLTAPLHWGIAHCDGMRLWRTVNNGTTDPGGLYGVVSNLYLVEPYIPKDLYNDGSDIQYWSLYVEPDPDGTGADLNDETDRVVTYQTDEGLTAQTSRDPYLDDFGVAPRMKRMIGFDGMLLGVTDAKEPASPDKDWTEVEQWPEAIVWSALHLTIPEPENFPTANYWPLDDPSESVLSLEAGSSTAFAVTNSGVYRIARQGGAITLIKSSQKVGGVSRHGQTVVGNTLYFVSQSGIKEVDGNTGAIRNVNMLSRVVTDDNEWAQSLDSIHMEYDAYAGCIILLNTTTSECILYWEQSGAITKLRDCPWVYLTGGSDVKSSGAHRAYFVTSTGGVQCIDAYRSMGKRTMCGTAAGETVNGTVTSASGTNIVDSGATFPANCVGFKVYILSGDRSGDIATVTTRNGDTDLSVSGLGGSLAVGDRYSVAPIYSKLVFPQLWGFGGQDPFVVKLPKSTSASFYRLSGESSAGTDPNAKVTMGIRVNQTEGSAASEEINLDTEPDACVARTNTRGLRCYPYLEFKGSNLDWELESILVKGQVSGSEAKSHQS